MKITALALFALTAAGSMLTASAQTAPPLHSTRTAPGPALAGPPRLGAMLRTRLHDMDTNNDGRISLEEFLAPRLDRLDALIAHLDTNSDGVISQDEIRAAGERPPRRQRLARPAPDRAAVLACVQSSNPDFDPPEVPDPEAIAARFDQADSNGDGKLNLAELSAAVTARATAQFKRLDKDGDGFLTTADRNAVQAERAAQTKAVQACIKAGK